MGRPRRLATDASALPLGADRLGLVSPLVRDVARLECVAKRISPSSAYARITSPSPNSPSSSRSASGFSSRRWIARLSGRAPYAGSQPASARSSRAPSVSSSASPRSARRRFSRASCSVDDRAELLAGERFEDHDLVDPVQELGPEPLGQVLGRANVRGHDHDRVAEVDRAAMAVGQPAVVEQLQEDVEHLRMGLLDLVEQDHRVRTAPNRLGQLAALLVADVPGRRTRRGARRCASPGTPTCRAARSRARRRT